MNDKDYFFLGIITKHFGYKGEVFLFLDTDEPEKYIHLQSIFIELDNELLPFLIEKINYRGGQLCVIKLKDVDFEQSTELIKANVYLPISMLPPLTGNQFYYHEVIDFQIIDKKRGNIGICKDFMDTGHQPIMQIDCNGTEILIPAVDHFFEKIDRENKKIFIDAPEGLIELYLAKK